MWVTVASRNLWTVEKINRLSTYCSEIDVWYFEVGQDDKAEKSSTCSRSVRSCNKCWKLICEDPQVLIYLEIDCMWWTENGHDDRAAADAHWEVSLTRRARATAADSRRRTPRVWGRCPAARSVDGSFPYFHLDDCHRRRCRWWRDFRSSYGVTTFRIILN